MADRTRLDGFEIEIIKLVRKEATSKQWKEWLRVPLEHAAAKGNMDLFTRLMDAGADGSAGWRGCHGRTLLGSAARGKSEKMVLALLKAGAKADLDVKFGENSESALHVAAAQGADAVSAVLMLAGADPKLQDGAERSPLHVAAEAGHHVIVKELLLKGACPNATTQYVEQDTPLHLAAKEGHALCVSKLLIGGADKDPINYNDETPLYLAAKVNQLCAVEELLDAGANVNFRFGCLSVLDRAAVEGHEDVVRALLRHGGDVKACDIAGNTALHRASQDVDGPVRDNGSVVRVLLEAGANIEAKETCGGLTPLHCAAKHRRAPSGTMCALLEGGADVNALSWSGWTPLHRACCHSSVAGVELLLRWGANEKETTKGGNTAADVVGAWEPDDVNKDINESRKTDDQRIRHMLARAPADRSWRRRGWLVLCRSYPTKVPLATNSGSISAKVAKAGCDSSRGGDETGDRIVGLGDLVGRVVGLEAEDVFRLVVGFV